MVIVFKYMKCKCKAAGQRLFPRPVCPLEHEFRALNFSTGDVSYGFMRANLEEHLWAFDTAWDLEVEQHSSPS